MWKNGQEEKVLLRYQSSGMKAKIIKCINTVSTKLCSHSQQEKKEEQLLVSLQISQTQNKLWPECRFYSSQMTH